VKKLGRSILLSFLVTCPPLVMAQTRWPSGSQREAVEGSRTNNNRERPQRSSDNDAEAAANEAIRVSCNQKIAEANLAVEAGNYREAARLIRAALEEHKPLGENKASRSWRTNAEYFENQANALDAARAAATAGNAAVRSGNYALALEYYAKMLEHPRFKTPDNLKVIEEIKALLQAQLDREQREKAEIKLAATLRLSVSKLAASLDTGPPKSGRGVLVTDGTVVDPSGLGARKAAVLKELRFGDPNDPENFSEQARQVFDGSGNLMGSEPVKNAMEVTAREVLPVTIPERFSKNKEIMQSQENWKVAGEETAAAQKELAKIKESRKKPGANKEELDVEEVKNIMKLKAAQSKQQEAVEKITETVKTLTFNESKVN